MVSPTSKMGQVGDSAHWHPADASSSNQAASNFLDVGAETNKCGICSAEIVNRGVLDCCNHWFCFSCIDDWATVTNLCPLCKARFRFITCLPVGYGDPDNPDKIGAGFAKRVDESADDESNFPFSFPSYFIDEEAVICLEGDACRVRAGLSSLEVEGALAADTSVACDLCDCWYHAGCVDFDPEESSFYCPRCIASQEKPKNSFAPGGSGSRVSSEARASSLVGSLPAEKELSYGSGTVLGSASVAIAVAEKGESAVSFSMRRIAIQTNAQPTPSTRQGGKGLMWSPTREPISPSKSCGLMWSPIREPVNACQSHGPMWSPIREPLNMSKNFELWSPTRGPISQDEDEQLWSPTPESERASANIFKEVTSSPPEVPGNFVAVNYSVINGETVPKSSTSVAHAAPTPGPHVSQRIWTPRGPNVSSVEMDSQAQAASKTIPLKHSEDFASPGLLNKDEKMLIDADSLHITVERLTKGKRKLLQEDERRVESKDLPESPRKVGRKSVTRSPAPQGKILAPGRDFSEKVVGKENSGDERDDTLSKGLYSVDVSTDEVKEVTTEETAMEQIDEDHHGKCLNQAVKGTVPEKDTNSHVEVMDIVSESRKQVDNVRDNGETLRNQKGVRTRIIMHRETDANDTVGSGLVDPIRQQMKATAGYIGGEDLSKVEVSDDRFLAAFKSALLSSREKNKETKASPPSRGKSLWLDKVLNRNSKGSRDSLTRKLYAGGTGRYDRDWDIAFWKERSAHFRTAQKEAETKITGKRAKEDGNQPEEEDSIFSRIYVADTSLFPRTDDVQLLSDKVKNLVEVGGKRAGRAPKLSQNKDSLQGNVANQNAKSSGLSGGCGSRITPTSTCKLSERPSGTFTASNDGSAHDKGKSGAVGTTTLGFGGKPGSSPKMSTSGFLATSVTEPPQASKADVKKDKRQWALEVLARKTGSSLNGSSNSGGSAKPIGCQDSRDGRFSLLLQLPIEMRPVLQHNRKSRVPTAVRQVHLDRFVEQEMRNAKIALIQNSYECEEAINRAKSREENLYKKSNSKGVYLNLCVRSLAQTDTVAVKEETKVDDSEAIQKALEATGLVESPSASPSHDGQDRSAASWSKEPRISSNDSSDKQKSSCETLAANILETGNLDGGFEFSPDTGLEDGARKLATVPTNFSNLDPEAATPNQDPDSRTNELTVVLSTPSNATSEYVQALPVTCLGTPDLNETTKDGGMKAGPMSIPRVSIEARRQMNEGDYSNGEVDVRFTVVPSNTLSCVTSKSIPAHSVSSSSKECVDSSPPNKDLKSCGGTAEGGEKDIQTSSDVKMSQSSTTPAIQNMDDWMNSGKFADLDRRIENIRQNTSPSVNEEIDVPWNSKRSSIELATHNDLQSPQHSVQKQVEIYVNQHLKPLYRSGVINSDQFRYAVSKTAAKVMEHHENATSAEFLITEGSKVRKLADQYLQNYTKRKVK